MVREDPKIDPNWSGGRDFNLWNDWYCRFYIIEDQIELYKKWYKNENKKYVTRKKRAPELWEGDINLFHKGFGEGMEKIPTTDLKRCDDDNFKRHIYNIPRERFREGMEIILTTVADKLDIDAVKALAGDQFDEAKFNELKDEEGFVSKEALLALAPPAVEEAAPAAAPAAPAAPLTTDGITDGIIRQIIKMEVKRNMEVIREIAENDMNKTFLERIQSYRSDDREHRIEKEERLKYKFLRTDAERELIRKEGADRVRNSGNIFEALHEAGDDFSHGGGKAGRGVAEEEGREGLGGEEEGEKKERGGAGSGRRISRAPGSRAMGRRGDGDAGRGKRKIGWAMIP